MDLAVLAKELIDDEGLRLIPYICPAGKLTIGVGHNLTDNGLTRAQRDYLDFHEPYFDNLRLTETQAMQLFGDDVRDGLISLRYIFKAFDEFPDELQHILINLFHQLGYSRFAGFCNMIIAIKKRDFKEAAKELRDSKLWREETPRS